MKKILYIFIVIVLILIASLFVAVNSSYVVDKIARKYAPKYNINYKRISGNLFTGVKIEKLQFNNQIISDEIVYRWNPLALLQKKISIEQLKIQHANIDTIKSLIASFDTNESKQSSKERFDFDIEVADTDISINPFIQNDIAVNKVDLSAEDIAYRSSGEVEIEELYINIDSNLTQFMLQASMQERNLKIKSLSIAQLDTEMLEEIINRFSKASQDRKNKQMHTKSEQTKALWIPKSVYIDAFRASIIPRVYISMAVKLLDVTIEDAKIDIENITKKQITAIGLGNLALEMETNVTSAQMNLSLDQGNVTFERVILKDIDTKSLQKLLPEEHNERHMANKKSNRAKNEPNHWIPKFIKINRLHANFLAAKHTPVEIEGITITGKNIGVHPNRLHAKSGDMKIEARSNMSDIFFEASVDSNLLTGKLTLLPKDRLFKAYDLPLRAEAIEAVYVDLNASKERIDAYIHTKAKQLLQENNERFNIDIEHFSSKVAYEIKSTKLQAKSEAIIHTPYAQNILLANTFSKDDIFSYKGSIKAGSLNGLDRKIIEPLKNLDISYQGDKSEVHATLLSKQLKGSFHSSDMKKGRLLLETLERLDINAFVDLPKELNGSKMNLKVDFPINFDHVGKLYGKVQMSSDLVNLNADIRYSDALSIKAKTVIPQKSLLRKWNKNILWHNLTPLFANFDMQNEKLALKLRSKALKGSVKYHLQNHTIDGKIALSDWDTAIHGDSDSAIKIKTDISSMEMLKKSIATIYHLEDFPPLEGSATLTASITDKKRIDLKLDSPMLIYKANRKTKHTIKDLEATVGLEESKIVLDAYSLIYDKQKFYASKPSIVNIEDEKFVFESLWLNDALHITGHYNMKQKQGEIEAKADRFGITHEYADIDTMIDLKMKLDGNATTIDGNIELLEGSITYDIEKKSFASDSDIVILQDQKKQSKSPFMKNLSTNIEITTKKPLVLKQGAIDVKLKPEVAIYKAKNEKLMLLGSVNMLKGGSYIFEGKKFVLDKSAIHFTGNPDKPLLEIKVKYRSINHQITIFVSGTPHAPVINFSSRPSLSKEQILSLILFDTEAAGETHSGDEMMKMMGGAMAKSALSDLGVQVDHLVLGEGNSIEVGKKITDKITIIYVEGEVSRVKLQYRHSPRTESVLQMSEESQSYDIIFKDDF